jgi:uncharacterized protein (TIGR02265 family)
MAVSEAWGESVITAEQADRFAGTVIATPGERVELAKMYLHFPPQLRARGLYFVGVGRAVAKRAGAPAWQEVLARVGAPRRFFPFNYYPHRDLYKIHAMTANLLVPQGPLDRGLLEVGRLLYPIYRESLVGRTMSALAGNDPKTLLRILCESYRLSVDGNEHELSFDEGSAGVWRCRVEPSPWYPSIFRGIVEGTTASHGVAGVEIETLEYKDELSFFRYAFRICW